MRSDILGRKIYIYKQMCKYILAIIIISYDFVHLCYVEQLVFY